MHKLACRANLCYNEVTRLLCLSDTGHILRREYNLSGGCTVHTVPHFVPQRKPYVYFLRYPESMGGVIFYIGKGTGRRINVHEVEAKTLPATIDNPHKIHTIRKIWGQGEQVIKTKFASFDTDSEAYLYEFALIFFMQGYGNLTNIAEGGKGGTSYSQGKPRKPHTEEWKQQASKRLTGRIVSEETRQRISEATKGRRNSEEAIQRQRQAVTGLIPSPEARKKNSEAHRGKSPSMEHRRKLSESNKGKIYTEERRRNMSEGRKRAKERRELWQNGNRSFLF